MPAYTPFYENLDYLLQQDPLLSEAISEREDTHIHSVTIMEAVSSIPSRTCPHELPNASASSLLSLQNVSSDTTSAEEPRETGSVDGTCTVKNLDSGSDGLLRHSSSSKSHHTVVKRETKQPNHLWSTSAKDFCLIVRVPGSKASGVFNGYPTTVMAEVVRASSDDLSIQNQRQFLPCILTCAKAPLKSRKCQVTKKSLSTSALELRDTNFQTGTARQLKISRSAPFTLGQGNRSTGIAPHSLEHAKRISNKKCLEPSNRRASRARSGLPVPDASYSSVRASMLLLFLCPCILVFLAFFYILFKLSRKLFWLILLYLLKIVSSPFRILWYIANCFLEVLGFKGDEDIDQHSRNAKPLPAPRNDNPQPTSAKPTPSRNAESSSLPDAKVDDHENNATLATTRKSVDEFYEPMTEDIRLESTQKYTNQELIEQDSEMEYLSELVKETWPRPVLLSRIFPSILYPCLYAPVYCVYALFGNLLKMFGDVARCSVGKIDQGRRALRGYLNSRLSPWTGTQQ